MNLTNKVSATVVCFTLAALSFGSLVYLKENKTEEKRAPSLTAVEVIKPSEAEFKERIEVIGQVLPTQEAIVEVQISGLPVAELKYNVGDRVKKGQTLAKLDPTLISLERNQLQAQIKEAQVLTDNAKKNYDRALSVKGTDAISDLEFLQFETQFKTNKARVDSLKAQLALIEHRISRKEIVAPLSGTISERNLALGASSVAGQRAFKISSDEQEVKLEIPAIYANKVAPESEVRLKDPLKGEISSKISRVSNTLSVTKTAPAFALLPGEPLIAGQFIEGEVFIGSKKSVSVPQSAIIARNGFVYLAKVVDDRISFVKVLTGQSNEDQVEILSPIDKDSFYVKKGAIFLSEGEKIRVIQSELEGAQ